jgi:uncharacterized protein (TIGR02996 family)
VSDELLRELADHDFDKRARLIFADTLLEGGDPRGEVIALSERGGLSLTERRKINRLTERHALAWLGELAPVVDAARCRFVGGFLTECTIRRGPKIDLTTVVGNPELVLVNRLSLGSGEEVPKGLERFLEHPRLKNVTALIGGTEVWARMARSAFSFDLEAAGLIFNGHLLTELSGAARYKSLQARGRLELDSRTMITPTFVRRFSDDLGTGLTPLCRFPEVRLLVRSGVLEAAAEWLTIPAVRSRARTFNSDLEAWSLSTRDIGFCVRRDHRREWNSIDIDLGSSQGAVGLGPRVATAATIVLQLGVLGLREVRVVLPEQAKLRVSERDALRTASRRLASVERLEIDGQVITP